MAVSSHLDESMHVFGNGTTARLMVTPWTRNTVADGYWQNTNTIRPLSARDVYLAECIDKLSASQVAYNAGPGIAITPSETSPNQYIISYDADSYKETTYSFGAGITATSIPSPGTNSKYVGLNVDGTTVRISNDCVYCNLDDIAVKYVQAIYKKELQTYEYTYSTGTANLSFTSTLPDNPVDGTFYLIG